MDLTNLEIDVVEMSKRVKESLNYAFSFYFDPSAEKKDIINDVVINEYERKIEEICLLNILKERPFATELRKLTGYFKVCEDLERLGDHAEDIYWVNSNLSSYKDTVRVPELDEMINKTLLMVNKAIDSLINFDEEEAKKIIKSDDEIDALYLEILSLLPKLKENNNLDDEFTIFTTLLVKYVERIADHASNVAEWAIYIKSGFYKDRYII